MNGVNIDEIRTVGKEATQNGLSAICDNDQCDHGVKAAKVEAVDPGANVTPEWRHVDIQDSEGRVHIYNQSDHLVTEVWESVGDSPFVFCIYRASFKGVCNCVHFIAGNMSQLKPCQFVVELFFRGDHDPGWVFLLLGVIFGFRVIKGL